MVYAKINNYLRQTNATNKNIADIVNKITMSLKALDKSLVSQYTEKPVAETLCCKDVYLELNLKVIVNKKTS